MVQVEVTSGGSVMLALGLSGETSEVSNAAGLGRLISGG